MKNRDTKAVVIIVFIAFFSSLLLIGNNVVLAQNTTGNLALSVTTDRSEYVIGDNVIVSGYVYDVTTQKSAENALVQVEIWNGNEIKYIVNEATINGTFRNGDFKVLDAGKLTINAKTTLNGVTTNASTTVNVKTVSEYFNILGVVVPPIIAIFSIIYILILLFPGATKKFKIEGRGFVAAEFAFLTLFTIGVSLFFVFNEAPLGINSPVGLVVNTYNNETQWILNIGGQLSANSAQYQGGIQIPIYVIALAFLGAYAYFIINVPLLLKEKDIDELECKGLAYLVRFFVAPLMAAALFLVLWQVDVKGTYILATTSFATGLIIEQVVDRIIDFAKNTIGIKKPPETPPQETKPQEQ